MQSNAFTNASIFFSPHLKCRFKELNLGVPVGNKSLFEPVYFWSYTMFRNKCYYTDDLYLGSDYKGKITLVKNVSLEYPNPQALFILNKY